MVDILIGIVMSIITQIAKKTEIDAKIIILSLSLIAGVAFYFIKFYYPEVVENVWQHTLGVYAVSQVVYNYCISFFEKKEE